MTSIKRVMIVGCPRSGTTLLQSILSAHKEVFSLPETHFYPQLCSSNPFFRHFGLSTRTARNNLKQIGKDYLDKKINTSLLTKKLSQSFLETLDQASQIRGKSTWIEKTPQNLWFLSFIKSITKDIYFIHIEREPKDVIASIHYASTKHPDSWGYQNIDHCISLYKESKKFNDQYRSTKSHYFCKYEELASDPPSVIKCILKFCQLEFYEDLLLDYKKSRNFISRKSDLWTSGISSEIKLQESRFYKHFPEEDQNYILNKLDKLS